MVRRKTLLQDSSNMGQEDSRPSKESTLPSSSSVVCRTDEHTSGARPDDEGLLTPAALISPATLAKVNQISVTHQCTDCEYKATTKKLLRDHRVYHDVKSAHQCPWCSFSVSSMNRLAIHVKYYHTKTDKKALATEKQSNSVAEKRAEEWHYFPGGKTSRVRYKFCVDCDYKSITNSTLNAHIKLMHPFSTTALQSLTLKKEQYKCLHCPFKTTHKTKLERHDACHGKKSTNHPCHFCNYSVNDRGHLALHLKLHYREMDENNKDDQLANKEKDRDNKSTSRTSRNSRRSLLSCRHCCLFKTTSRFTLKRHVKRAHPFSLSALPPLLKKRKRNSHPPKKSGLKVAQKVHQKTTKGTRGEWYVPPSERRKRYIYCGDYDYKTETRTHLNQHGRAKYPTSTTISPAKPPKKARAVRQNRLDPNQDPSGNEDSLIDSSVNKNVMNRHVNLNLLETPAHIQDVPLETRLRKQFGTKECRVILHDIQPLPVKVVNPKNAEQLLPTEEAGKIADVTNPEKSQPNEEAGHIAYVSNPENAELSPPNNEEVDHVEDGLTLEGQQEGNGKMQLLEIRIRSTEERARILDEDVKEISSKKMDVQKKIDAMERRMVLNKYNLLLEQRSLLEMELAAHETGEEPSEILKQSLEEEVESMEDEIKMIDGELQALKEEKKSLDQNLEDARGSHFRVIQVLEALQLKN